MLCFSALGQSYLAFELATRLRRQGQLTIVNIDEELADSRQLPQISGEFITEGAGSASVFHLFKQDSN
jgi:hypothetical protein